jgi:glycosyltransferase involved in cell wall biosynthesis
MPLKPSSDSNLDLSIIIPVRNHGPDLRELLTSLRDTLPDDIASEIIVVDDASREDIAGMCAAFSAQCLRHTTSRGPAHARNTGAAAARGDLLFFLDADIVAPPGMAATAVTLLRENPDMVGVSFINQIFRKGDSTVRNFGAVQENFWFTLPFTAPDQLYAETRGFTTRNGAVRRSVFEAMGGFDTSFQTNAIEDYDFGKRLAAQGRTVMAREPLAYHKFPDNFLRLMRNYWVRVTLFVPYQMRHRHQFDKVQIGPAEASVRMAGAVSLGLLLLALAPTPARAMAALLGIAGTTGYVVAIRGLLRAAHRQSGGLAFPVAMFFIHWAASVVICAGGALGLVSGLLGQGGAASRQTE